MNGVLLEYPAQQGIPHDQRQVQTYLRGLDPTLEELLRRTREVTISASGDMFLKFGTIEPEDEDD